jgi:AraC-like DNA-binding protein
MQWVGTRLHEVQQVAYGLGYESPSAFITMFKKAFGKPPATYIGERLRAG